MANYPDFIEHTGYGDVAGLCGANCRHSFGPYFENISLESYSVADLDEFSSRTVSYTTPDGESKSVSYYEGTQYQRSLERKIRYRKRRCEVRKAAGLDDTSERKKLKYWQNRIKLFTEETGLRRDYARERIAQP